MRAHVCAHACIHACVNVEMHVQDACTPDVCRPEVDPECLPLSCSLTRQARVSLPAPSTGVRGTCSPPPPALGLEVHATMSNLLH